VRASAGSRERTPAAQEGRNPKSPG